MPSRSRARALDHPEKIAIVRFSALGDIVHTLPAFQRLRTALPGSHITWFVHPPGARLLSLVKGLDAIEVVTLKGPPWLERLWGLKTSLDKHRQRFDLTIDFQGLIKSGLFAKLLGAPVLGFDKSDLREPLAGALYAFKPPPFPDLHVIDQNLHLLSPLNLPKGDDQAPPLEITPPDPDTEEGGRLTSLVETMAGSFVLLNLGGAWPTKQYDAPFWTTLIKSLPSGARPLLLWGQANELTLAQSISAQTAIPIVPFLSFANLLWLISRSRLVISSDSLALHLSDLTQTPSIGLFGPTNPARNGSRLRQSRSIRADVPCDYCYLRQCDKMTCQRSLSPVRVAQLVNEVMEQNG